MDQMQRCLDNVFRKRPLPKICEEEIWKIENNDKEEVQFQILQKVPAWRAYEERKNFPLTIEKGIQLAAVR